MSKPEIQPSAPGKRRVLSICRALLLGHGFPDTVALLVAPDVVEFGEEEQENDGDVDDDEVLVALLVQGLVMVLINVRGCNASSLNGHLRNG